MKKTYFLLIALLALCSHTAWGWGKMGHDAIAYIAECHLTPKAKKTIERYLNTSIVHYASWMDAYRFEEPYAHTSLWHTAWVDENNNYDPTRKADGNAIKGIEDTMELLRDYIRVGSPVFLSGALWGIAMAIQTGILGHMGSSAIAANSVVLSEVPENATAVGIPAQIVRIAGKATHYADEVDQTSVENPVEEKLEALAARLDLVERLLDQQYQEGKLKLER